MKLEQYHQSRLALGSDCTLVIVTNESEAQVNDFFAQLWNIIFRFERQFSRFIPHSELSAFNRSAGLSVAITPEFRDILQVAKHLGETTGGLFNPFILPALQRAGYTKSHVPQFETDAQESYIERSVVTIDHLRVNDTTAIIPYGTALDLGGCGKGYLADLLANSGIPKWVRGFWFSIGGDVAGEGMDAHNKPWKIAISSGPDHENERAWSIRATSRRFAAATSGTRIRGGINDGERWHHIIDPRTLRPSVSDCYMATVYCESAVEADVLASCAIILGSAEGPKLLKQHNIKAALLQCNDTEKGDFNIRIGKSINIDG